MIVDTVESATDGRCILESAWYCGQTTVGRERQLERALARVGVETFLPLIRNHRHRLQYVHVIRDHEERHYTSATALFPGYVFARLGDYEWTRVKTKLGAGRSPHWVNFGGGPVTIPAEMIEAIRSGPAQPTKPQRYTAIKEGTPVQVLEGPLAGLSGIFDRELSGGDRVLVLMTVLGALRSVEFERRCVQKFQTN